MPLSAGAVTVTDEKVYASFNDDSGLGLTPAKPYLCLDNDTLTVKAAADVTDDNWKAKLELTDDGGGNVTAYSVTIKDLTAHALSFQRVLGTDGTIPATLIFQGTSTIGNSDQNSGGLSASDCDFTIKGASDDAALTVYGGIILGGSPNTGKTITFERGTVNAFGKGSGIHAYGDMKVSGGNVTGTGNTATSNGSPTYGVYANEITVTGGALTGITDSDYGGNTYGIYANIALNVSGGTVTGNDNRDSYTSTGISAYNFTASGGEVQGTGGRYGISLSGDAANISGNAKVTGTTSSTSTNDTIHTGIAINTSAASSISGNSNVTGNGKLTGIHFNCPVTIDGATVTAGADSSRTTYGIKADNASDTNILTLKSGTLTGNALAGDDYGSPLGLAADKLGFGCSKIQYTTTEGGALTEYTPAADRVFDISQDQKYFSMKSAGEALADPITVTTGGGNTPEQGTESFTASRDHFNPPGGVTVLTYRNTDPEAFAARKDKITLTCSMLHYDVVGEPEDFPVGEPVIGTDTIVWTVAIPENTIDYAVDYTFNCMIHDDDNNTDNQLGQIIVSVVAKTASIYVPVESVAVSPKTASVNAGSTVKLSAAVSPVDVSLHADQWTSSDESVATVSEEGVVTGVSAGTAVITFSASSSCQEETGEIVTVTKSDTCTVTVSAGGGSGGSSSGSSSGGGSSSNTSSTTTRNPDGSTTTRTENKTTGTVTETTKNTDGSTTTVEKKKDGTVTTTETAADGSTGTVTTDASGRTEASVALSAKAVSDAAGAPVTLPMAEIMATRDAGTAPVVTVKTGSSEPVKVEIPTGNITPGAVAVITNADGSEKVVKTSVPTENGVVVSLSDGATVKIVDNSRTFADVPADSWAADAVRFSSARELFGGTSENTFAPDAPMTRAMLMTVLARFDGEDTAGGATWYEKGVNWAVSKGVSNGSDPNGNITREQLAAMLWRYSGSPAASGSLDSFSDAGNVSDYAGEAMRWAVENGIINGFGNGQLAPQGQATRAQVAQMMKNFIEM